MMGEKRAERMRDLDKLRTEDDKVKAVAEPSEAQTQPPARVKLGESAPAKSGRVQLGADTTATAGIGNRNSPFGMLLVCADAPSFTRAGGCF